MNDLRFETYSTPAANLGPENPLPPLQRSRGLNFVDNTADNGEIPAGDREYLGYGFDVGLLPYRMQDGYDRQREQRDLRVAVLENEILRATFLLDYGGRLWSLFHKPSGRELLYVNPVFQPANLAVRNAWFSGGVEWNVSVPGHSPLTCSPLFATHAEDADGNPVLRLYEWERARGITFQIDLYLKADSPFLFVRVTLRNHQEHVTPMYWWSNIAVPEREDIRVLVPATHAYRYSYRGGLNRVPIPRPSSEDVSYATNIQSSVDYFYRIPDEQRPWIAALDAEGRGLIQASTSRLTGRKLFAWGTGPGGRRWQEFLAEPGKPYLEIQAGLARTQSHCLPMPPHAEWSWTEVYGLMETDPAQAHGADWEAAYQAVDQRLSQMLSGAELEAEHERMQRVANQPPVDLIHFGSGWGALERLRRSRTGEATVEPLGLRFPDASLTAEQEPWLALLETGEFPYRAPHQAPGAYLVQPEWHHLLQASLDEGKSNHWLAWLHLGVMHYTSGDFEQAGAAWRRSLELEHSGWAWRNLAVLAKHNGEHETAADFYLKAVQLLPDVAPLAIECCTTLLKAGRSLEIASLIAQLPPAIQAHSRLQLLRARAALENNDLDAVAALLNQNLEFADIREGEISLSDLWFGLHEKRMAQEQNRAIDDDLRTAVRLQFPPPPEIDFRMQVNS